MLTIETLSEKYDVIVDALDQFGFDQAILFKGFCEIEEHNFNLLVFDRYSCEDEPFPQTHRRLHLSDKLTEVLNIKCHILTIENMLSYYYQKLNANNSVTLSKGIDAAQFLDEIIKIFGYSWLFNEKIQSFDSISSDDEAVWQNLCREMEQYSRKDEVEEEEGSNQSYDFDQGWSNSDTDFSPIL